MSSAAAVLRSACYALRRPLFPRSALIERQPPPRLRPQAQNYSTRRFYSADCTVGKPETTNKAAVEDGVSRKLDEINDVFDRFAVALKEYREEVERERRRKVWVRRTIFASGVLAAIYVKRRCFFSGTTEDKEISAGNH